MMSALTWEERNVLVLLDPGNAIPVERWHFIRCSEDRYRPGTGLLLYAFPRKYLLHYLLFSLLLKCSGRKKEAIEVLKFQNGMTSSLFYTGNVSGYHAFVRCHAAGKNTMRERIKSLLPSFINAEMRYLAVGRELSQLKEEMAFDDFRFMFYSNESGKLILTAPETFITGSGQLLVTTANRAYHPVLEKEFEIIEQIGNVKTRLVPNLVSKITANGRLLFVEEYIAGTTLRETLRNESVANDREAVVDIIKRLDAWFAEYSSFFSGTKKGLSELYQSLLETFARHHTGNAKLERFLLALRAHLAVAERSHPGMVPVMAHNDLWPGNIIVSDKGLIVIDWERATPDRPELFDYFWMMISTFLEYHTGKTQSEDYSRSFRAFIECSDSIGKLIQEKLCIRLQANGLKRSDYDLFLALFLLEWSIQGLQALGRQTRMDKLALGELLHYLETAGDRFESVTTTIA